MLNSNENETIKFRPERAVLVASRFPLQLRWESEEFLDELALLADTAGGEVVARLLQERRQIDATYFIGKGKANELAELVKKLQADIIIFDDDLTPAQTRNLENLTEVKVIDRSGLILDIFARRAKTKEAKTQVELAQLQYLLPRLTRRWTHLSRQYGGILTRGPGETQLETDRRLVQKRIALLTQELKKISQQRDTRRKARQNLFKIALVGYTNTGKSTLLNALTAADVFTEDRLFATLDPTIRTLKLDSHSRALLIDTVGFIRKLPHHLIASFHSTLEEAISADLLLHVIDVSHPMFMEQVGTVNQVLQELKIEQKPVILVFNKIDRLTDINLITRLREKYPTAVFISAARGFFLRDLIREILKIFDDQTVRATCLVRSEPEQIFTEVNHLAVILDTEYLDDGIRLLFRISRSNLAKLKNRLQKFFNLSIELENHLEKLERVE